MGRTPIEALLRPGQRLGWVFRDRTLFRRPFPQPPPTPPEVPAALLAQARKANPHLTRNIAIAVPAVVLVSLVAVCGLSLTGRRLLGLNGPLLALAMAVVVGLALTAAVAWIWYDARRAREVAARPAAARAEAQATHERRLAQWQAQRAEFEAAERVRTDQLAEWGPATIPPGARRIDIVGGSLWGWEGLLTVFGSSTLASGGGLAVADLSGEALCRELLEVADEAGVGTDVQVLADQPPGALEAADLLSGLDTRGFVDVLVEALHGDGRSGPGAAGASRADRALDDRLLTAVCGVLGGHLSLGRVVAALRVLMDEPDATDAPATLTPDERAALTAQFSAAYRRDALPHLRRVEALLHPLARLGADARPRPPARLLCLTTDAAGARSELLADLVVQRLVRSVTDAAATSGGRPAPGAAPEQIRTVVVVGADVIARHHLERLSDVCERRDVRLVYLFRHLRDSSLQVLGAGAVGFMRLGNHEEATRAADFIGRQHRFVLSRLTRQIGGSQTHGTASSEGTDQTTVRTSGTPSLTRPWRALPGLGGSTSRSWRTTANHAQGTNWNDGAAYQRTLEHTVEPRTLQGLPDYALLLVTATPTGPVITPVECNPDIVTLPRVSPDPFPEPAGLPPTPGQARTALPPAAQPGHTDPTQHPSEQRYPPQPPPRQYPPQYPPQYPQQQRPPIAPPGPHQAAPWSPAPPNAGPPHPGPHRPG